jgi:hypothetical protein
MSITSKPPLPRLEGAACEPERVQLEGIRALFASLSEMGRTAGYLAAVFGSVLKSGSGRDLDVVFVPMYDRPQDPAFLVEILETGAGRSTARCVFAGEKLESWMVQIGSIVVHAEIRHF